MTEVTGTLGELADHPAVVTAFTIAVFVAAQKAQRRWPYIPALNPTLVGVLAVIIYVEWAGMSYQNYILNTQVLSFMLAPTVVLLAVPLYRRLALIRASWRIIACSLLVGLPTGILSAIAIALALGAKDETLYSLTPKSVTTGIAVGVSASIGGIPVLTAAFVIITGIFSAAFGPVLLRLLKVKDERAIGLAMGISGHGIGTARAFQISDKTGTFSSLAMALNGIATAIVVPGTVAVFHLSPASMESARRSRMATESIRVGAIADPTPRLPSIVPSDRQQFYLHLLVGFVAVIAAICVATYVALKGNTVSRECSRDSNVQPDGGSLADGRR